MNPALITYVKRFFTTEEMLEGLNHTNLCLIPKITNPKTMKDFRPISLCKVVYKIISKILVRRLKNVLPRVVSENQAAFISDRYITDNVLIAHEVRNWIVLKLIWLLRRMLAKHMIVLNGTF